MSGIDVGIEVELRAGVLPFAGPLDLLLAIVRQNRYPLDQLPLGAITRQYAAYLHAARHENLELGSDFFETASWLVLLKSRALLPEEPDALGQGSERTAGEELRRALVEHERVGALATFLGERMELAGAGPGRSLEPAKGTVTETVAAPPTVHDALLSARRALAAARAHTQSMQHVTEENVTVEEALRALGQRIEQLEPGRGVSTAPWFRDLDSPELRTALFLALLELARLGSILVYQPAPFGPIWLQRLAAGGRDSETGAGQ